MKSPSPVCSPKPDDVVQCWSTNVKSNLWLFKEALPTFNANPDGGSFIITSSTAVGD